jgi:hypothetical protein
MKILHVYPKANRQIAHYLSMLTTAMDELVSVQIADDIQASMQICRDWKPDIVHLHGNISINLPPKVRAVVSPHGQGVQQKGAYAIISRSPIEKQMLSETNSRIEIIRNPIITRSTTPQETADLMMRVYQKVMDTDVRELMDSSTLNVFHLLIKAGITCDRRWVAHLFQIKPQLSSIRWRQIFIYAYYEGIEDVLKKGIEVLGMTIPNIHVDTIPLYLPDNYKIPERHNGNVSTLLANIRQECAAGILSLCRIVDLHESLMFNALDEERLMADINAQKLEQLFGRLLQVSSEETLLDEGYMPCLPIIDHGTKQLKSLLNRHLKI